MDPGESKRLFETSGGSGGASGPNEQIGSDGCNHGRIMLGAGGLHAPTQAKIRFLIVLSLLVALSASREAEPNE
ncbi:hypothetical protein HYT45_03795 [Candidatus Uhrbacteria bacterium]|nr:hypothetical protein [Candidatus Uhrbacteria bacterium]